METGVLSIDIHRKAHFMKYRFNHQFNLQSPPMTIFIQCANRFVRSSTDMALEPYLIFDFAQSLSVPSEFVSSGT